MSALELYGRRVGLWVALGASCDALGFPVQAVQAAAIIIALEALEN